MKEYEIRPKHIFDSFLSAARRDAERLLAERMEFVEIGCPACGVTEIAEEFAKHGFQYRACAACGSLYVSPRPSAEQLDSFYRSSQSVEYFASEFYRETEQARRERIFRPRAKLVAEWAARFDAGELLADVGAGYGTFLEEVRATAAFNRLVAIEPAEKLAQVCREKGFEVLDMPVEKAAGLAPGACFCTCFEVFEHVFDPLAFVQALGRVVREGGLVLFTTLTISGFDLQELWDSSKSISPPNHINLLSTPGLRRLVERSELELLDLSTPGQLDVDIVENAVREMPGLTISRFARRILESPESARQAFQRFLQENCLSSHVRVIVRRPGP